jgi:hypothetical protein
MGPADSRAQRPAGSFQRWWSRLSPLARVGVILLPPVVLCCGLVPALAVVDGPPEDRPAPDGTPVATSTTAPPRTTAPSSAAPAAPSKTAPATPSPSTSPASPSPSPTPSSPSPPPRQPSAESDLDQRYSDCAAVLDNGLGPYLRGVDPEFEWYRSEDANRDGIVCATATERVPPEAVPEPTNNNEPAPSDCHPSYPDICIPPPPPDLDCRDVPDTYFTVLPPDPHRFDRDKNGLGCET